MHIFSFSVLFRTEAIHLFIFFHPLSFSFPSLHSVLKSVVGNNLDKSKRNYSLNNKTSVDLRKERQGRPKAVSCTTISGVGVTDQDELQRHVYGIHFKHEHQSMLIAKKTVVAQMHSYTIPYAYKVHGWLIKDFLETVRIVSE